MPTEWKSLTVMLPDELLKEADQVKLKLFPNASKREMYRCLIALGLIALKEQPLRRERGEYIQEERPEGD